MMCTVIDNSSGTRKQEKANIQYDKKSLHHINNVNMGSEYKYLKKATYFTRITSTAWRNKSHVLYSKGSSFMIMNMSEWSSCVKGCLYLHQKSSPFPFCLQVACESNSWLWGAFSRRATRASELLFQSISSCSALWEPSPDHRHMRRARRQSRRKRKSEQLYARGRNRARFENPASPGLVNQGDSWNIQDGKELLGHHALLARGTL